MQTHYKGIIQHTLLEIKLMIELQNTNAETKKILSRFLKVDNSDAVRMSGGKLFHAAGPATQNAQFRRHCLVRGTSRSP